MPIILILIGLVLVIYNYIALKKRIYTVWNSWQWRKVKKK